MSLEIYKPVKGRMTQKYGESRACALTLPDSDEIAFPCKVISKPKNGKCPTGYTSLYEALGLKGHAGEDFCTTKREPQYFDIYAEDQQGNEVEWEIMKTNSPSAGHGILIRSLKPIPLKKAPEQAGASLNLTKRQYDRLGGAVHLMRYYGHFDEASNLRDRQVIKCGDKVGLSGTTGLSSGVHVHRHLMVCGTNEMNPFFYLDGDSDMKGRINEQEWYDDTFVLDALKVKKKPFQQ